MRTRSLLGFLALLLATASLALACNRPLHQARWLVAETPHFEILTTLTAAEARDLARELEAFRALIAQVTRLAPDAVAVPTKIVVLARPSEYAQLGDIEESGQFALDLRANWLLVRSPHSSWRVPELVLHQYAHVLLRGGSPRSLPDWYEEGLAAIFSGVERRGDAFVIGGLPRTMHRDFNHPDWEPIADLIGYELPVEATFEERSIHLAQSWALVHALTLDWKNGRVATGTQLDRYLDLLELGSAPEVAFRAAFGETTEQAARRIDRVLRAGRIGVVEVPLSDLTRTTPEAAIRKASASEVSIRLGELALQRGDAARAEQEFRRAVDLDPHLARAHAGLGLSLARRGRLADAEAALEHAIEIEPDDPRNLLDLGAFHAERARDAESLRHQQAALDRARVRFERALALDEESAEPWARLGLTYLAPGEDARTAANHLARAFARNPGSPAIVEAYAEAELARGDRLLAESLLRRARTQCGRQELRNEKTPSMAQLRAKRERAAQRLGFDEPARDPS